MPFGGPVSHGNPYAAARESRARLAEAMRIQKEARENNEAIAREQLKMRQAQSDFEQSQEELRLLQQREAEIQAAPGKAYRSDPILAEQMYEAQKKLENAKRDGEMYQNNIREMVRQRNDVVDKKNIPNKSRGWFSSSPMTEEELAKDPKEFGRTYAANQEAERATDEGKEFEKDLGKERGGLAENQNIQDESEGKLEGLKRKQEEGRAEQQEQNREQTKKDLFPLEQKEADERRRQQDSRSAMEAASQGLAARQSEGQFIQNQPNLAPDNRLTYSGGSGVLGLLGAIATKAGNSMGHSQGGGGGGASSGKAGGSAAPTPPSRPGTPMPQARPQFIGQQPQPPVRPATPAPPPRMATPAPPPRPGAPPPQQAPTVGQLAAPVLGKIADMPAHQLEPAIKQALGQGTYRGQPYTYATPGGPMSASGFQGGAQQQAAAPMPPQRPQMQPTYGARLPPVRPQFGEQAPGAPPRRPVIEPGAQPAVAMRGRGGGGMPEVSGRVGIGQAYDLIKQAGGSDEEARTLAAISRPESAGNPSAYNPRGADNSYGLWQINMKGPMGGERMKQFGLKSPSDLFNPATNARVALALHRQRGGYGDWSTYKSGKYKPYLGESKSGGGKGVTPEPSGPVGRQYAEEAKQQPQQQQTQPQQQPQPQKAPAAPREAQGQQAPWQSQQQPQTAQGPKRPEIGPPVVQNPGDEMKMGLAPGSIFRTPDGRLKIVPIQPLQAGQ